MHASKLSSAASANTKHTRSGVYIYPAPTFTTRLTSMATDLSVYRTILVSHNATTCLLVQVGAVSTGRANPDCKHGSKRGIAGEPHRDQSSADLQHAGATHRKSGLYTPSAQQSTRGGCRRRMCTAPLRSCALISHPGCPRSTGTVGYLHRAATGRALQPAERHATWRFCPAAAGRPPCVTSDWG